MAESRHNPALAELERLLIRRGAAECTEEDYLRLAEIIDTDAEARDRYLDHCQLHALLSAEKGLLADLAGDAPDNILSISGGSAAFPIDEPDDLDERPTTGWLRRISGVAALLIVSAATAMVISDFSSGPIVPSEGPEGGAATSTPESEYEERMANLPGHGSLNRKPTTFTNAGAGEGDGKVHFNRDIRPILSENCFSCHGPDSSSRKADLRLDTKSGALSVVEGADYVPFIPKDPEASEAYYRITTDDEDEVMPPPKSHKNLTDAQKNLIRRWIEEGAVWEDHWAFIPPVRPSVPEVNPGDGSADWSKNPIDALLLAAMERKGLVPSQEADPETLIRRVTLDLTGLPPTPGEVEAFVSDKSPDAYEKLVKRLLDSPRFGEHRARYWLDAVRYADTHGFHFDNFRRIWPYRDWVVRAFNSNLPFDQFALYQIAGDLLPSPTEDQLVATGYNRCNPTTNEGGIIDKEYLSIYAKDRTDTTATVFMGLTMGCAGCHDHKFDPISQKDYYQLVAFFNNSEVPAKDGNRPDSGPTLKVVPPEHKKQAEAFEAEIASEKARLKAIRDEARAKFAVWEKSVSAGMFAESVPGEGLLVHLPLDGKDGEPVRNLASTEGIPAALAPGTKWGATGKSGSSLAFDGTGGIVLGNEIGDFEKDEAFSYGGWVKIPKGYKGSAGILARMDEKAKHRGWDLWVQTGTHIAAHFIDSWSDNALKVSTVKPVLVPDKWVHVFVTYDGTAKPGGIRIYINGVPAEHTVEADALRGSIRTRTPLKIGQRSHAARFTGNLDELRIYDRQLNHSEVALLAGSAHLRTIVETPFDKRTDVQREILFDYFLDTEVGAAAEINARIASLERQKNSLMTDAVTTLIMREKAGDPYAHILERGEYNLEKERVGADVPELFSDLPEGMPRNRLALARWLVHKDHPLTARVTVNRFWQNVFGTGIVKTSEDFGVMGEPPTHPELLDWLAVEFMESGWDVKHMFRLMVTSAAYRQSSKFSEKHLDLDPNNRYLARGPRQRLDAEAIRDQALFVSGLLNEQQGGPPVKPYQPPGLWKVVAYPKSDTANFVQDTGEKLYRRSIYTFWKRTSPSPSMTIFDAPDRESCTVRRERTNTPLQALVLMNDPQFVEASRHLARRVLLESKSESLPARIQLLFRTVVGRSAPEQSVAALTKSFEQFMASFTQKPESAQSLISVGDSPIDSSLDPIELAAWTLIANQVLNSDLAINKP